MNKRLQATGALVLLGVAGGLGVRAYRGSERFLDQQWSPLNREQFQAQLTQNKNQPAFLYHFAKLLNTQERFRDAQTLLETAAERQPDSARIRNEWAKALIGQGNVTGGFNVLAQFVKAYPDSAEGHLNLARFYVSQIAMDRAGEELDQALKLDSGLGEAWFLLAVARDHNSDQAAALNAIRKAVTLRPESAPDHALLGDLLRGANDPNGARTALEKAVQLNPKQASYHRSLGTLLLGLQDAARAEKEARAGIQCDPEEADSHVLLAQALQLSGKWKESVAPLTTAAKLAPFAPSPADLLRSAARKLSDDALLKTWEGEYLRRRSEADSLQKAEEAVRRNAKDPVAQRGLARLLARRGDVVGALRHHGAAASAPVDAPIVLIAAGKDLTAEKHPDLALPVLRDAARETQRSPLFAEVMGDTLLALNRPREASLFYQRVASLEPQKRAQFKAKLQAAYEERTKSGGEAEKVYQEARRLQESRIGPSLTIDPVVALLEKAVTLAPEITDYRRELVRAYVERRENDKAIHEGRTLLALSPEDTLNRALLAVALLETAQEKDTPELVAHFNAAFPDPVARPMVHYGRGVLALRRKKGEEAVAEFQKALSLDPLSESTWNLLSQAFHLTGDDKGARLALQEFKRIQTDKKAEVDVLKPIADEPNRRELYDKAIAFYEKRGGQAQANAIRLEQQRRFGK